MRTLNGTGWKPVLPIFFWPGEALATPTFLKKQETNYLVKDTIIKEITAFVAPGLLSLPFMKMGGFPLAFPMNL